MGAFMERGVDSARWAVVDLAGRARSSRGPNAGVSFLELPLDAVAVDSVEKADPFDDFANRLLGARRAGVRAGKFDGARLDRADEKRPVLGRIVDQMHTVEGFHMREHLVDVCHPEAYVPRAADVVRFPGRDLLPAGRTVKREQFQIQILRTNKRNLQ